MTQSQKQPQDTVQIKTRPDGSIDTQHYMQIGRRLRSNQAHRMVAKVTTPTSCEPQNRTPWWKISLPLFGGKTELRA